MKIAVTGGTGLLGRRVVVDLASRGYVVVAGCRDLEASSPLRERLERDTRGRVQWVRCRLESPEELGVLCSGCEGLVHMAYAHEPGRYRGGEGADPDAFWRVNMAGTLSLVDAAESAGVARTVAISSRAVFDGVAAYPASGIPDDYPVAPSNRYGELKAMTEVLVRSRGSKGVAALRPTGIFGSTWPWSESKWWALARAAVRKAPTPPTSDIPRTEVRVEDTAAAIALLLAAPHEAVAGRVFNCSDIVVSTQATLGLMESIATGSVPSLDEMQERLRPLAPPMKLKCDGLSDLGWRPAGLSGYLEVLRALVVQANASQANR